MKHVELEHFFNRRLHELPVPQAPLTLVPRVLRAIQRQTVRPWYERSWPSWPRAWQTASLAALAALLAGMVALQPAATAAVGDVLSGLSNGGLDQVTNVARDVQTTAEAVNNSWRILREQVVGYLVALAILMWASSAALGATLARLALGRTSQP